MTGPPAVFSVAQLIHKWMSSVVCEMTLLLRSDAEAARFSIGRGPSKCGRRRSTCDRSMRGQAARVLISCATRLLQCRPADPAGAASAHQGSGRDAADERSRRALERLPEHSSKCDGSRCSRRRLPLAPVWHLRAESREHSHMRAQAWRDRGPPGCCARRRGVRGSGSGSTPPRGRTVAGGSGATIAAAAAAAAAGAAPRASFCVTCDIAPDSERPVRHPPNKQ